MALCAPSSATTEERGSVMEVRRRAGLVDWGASGLVDWLVGLGWRVAGLQRVGVRGDGGVIVQQLSPSHKGLEHFLLKSIAYCRH